MKKFVCFVLLLLGALVGSAGAQDRFDLSLSGRAFPGTETAQYLGLSATYHAPSGVDYILRGSTARVSPYFASGFQLRTGGNDAEFMMAAGYPEHPEIRGALGISLPTTPAINGNPVGTYDLTWSPKLRGPVSFEVGLKGTIYANLLTLVTLKATYKLGSLQLFAYGGAPFIGENARSTVSGSEIRGMVGEAGVRCDLSKAYLQASYTNALGTTTGLSSSPTLGGKYGVALTVGVHF